MGEEVSLDNEFINSTDEIILEEFYEHLRKKFETEEKRCRRIVKFVEFFPVLAMLGLVTLGALHYEYNLLSTGIHIGIKSS